MSKKRFAQDRAPASVRSSWRSVRPSLRLAPAGRPRASRRSRAWRTQREQGRRTCSTKGSPRKLSGFGIGPMTGALHAKAVCGRHRGRQGGRETVAKLQKLTVGYLDIIGGIESADRVDNSLRTAFQHLGAKWIYCDGQGSPQKWATCGNSLIAQGVERHRADRHRPVDDPVGPLGAKAKNIPIVDFGGAVGPGFTTAFAPNEPKAGAVLAAYLKAKLASQSGTSDILTLNYPASWAQQRTAQLNKVVAGDPNLKITEKATTDPTNLIAGTQKTVTDELTADPNLKAIWARLRHRRPGGRPGHREQVPGQVVPGPAAARDVPRRPEHPDADAQRCDRRGRRRQLRRHGVGARRRGRRALRSQQAVAQVHRRQVVPRHRRPGHLPDRDAAEPAAEGHVRRAERRRRHATSSPSGRRRASASRPAAREQANDGAPGRTGAPPFASTDRP